jgi:Zn-dependent protease with chaperone function
MRKTQIRFMQSLLVAPSALVIFTICCLARPNPVVLLVLVLFTLYSTTRNLHLSKRNLRRFGNPSLALVVRRVSNKACVMPPVYVGSCRKTLAYYNPLDDAVRVSSRWYEINEQDPTTAEAIIAHEMGHRAQGGFVLCRVTNFTVALSQVMVMLFPLLFNGLYYRQMIITAVATWSVFAVGFLLSKAGSRALEHEADAFAASLGYAPEIVTWLSRTSAKETTKPPFLRSHPTTKSRVAALAQL